MSDIGEELWALFRDEATEGLDELFRLLHVLGDAQASEVSDALDAAFRIMHNIKGAARLAGAPLIEAVAHTVEDAFSVSRNEGVRPSPELLQLVREGAGLLARMVGGERPVEAVAVFVSQMAALGSNSEARDVGVGAAYELVPARAAMQDAAEPFAPRGDEQATATVRVETARLDRLMHFASELMLAQGRVKTQHEALERSYESLLQTSRSLTSDARAALRPVERELAALLQSSRRDLQGFGYLVSDWSLAVKRVRMLSLSSASAHLRRTVAEAAHTLGREVELVTELGDLEIDRQILDRLRDPLMHLLRNAVDHGIEPPEQRVRLGKPRMATVKLRARALGTMVELEVSDDGRGLDPKHVGQRALERGLVDEERLSRMSPNEALELVFLPGFSTAERVTELSGRGVGLDVVRRRLTELGGHARMFSEPGRGTTFRLEVPATIVSTSGLLVRTSRAAYALPTAYVLRTLRVNSDRVQKIDGGAAVHEQDGEPLRLRWLASLMQEPREPDPDKLLAVVITDGVHRLGLVVREVLGEVEFVTKPMPWNVPHIHGLAGAMILGSGEVGLVADVPRLLGAAASTTQTASEGVQRAPAKRAPRVLVVDDSLTSRTLERNILTAAGYEVETAVDGEAAWQALQAEQFDLVVSDVQMPKLDGLGLVKRVRAHTRFKGLPMILVTSLDSPGDIAQGASAGADEYLVKGRFDQRKLLEAVARLV